MLAALTMLKDLCDWEVSVDVMVSDRVMVLSTVSVLVVTVSYCSCITISEGVCTGSSFVQPCPPDSQPS